MTAPSTESKKAFDFSRNSIWVCDPTTDLAIIGGKKHLRGQQAGDLDTSDGPEHPLYQGFRLDEVLDDSFIASIDAFGVIEPIVIAKRDGIAVVVEGRTRVRGARVVNARRKASGQPMITVQCVQRRDDDTGLMAVMLVGNAQRTNLDVVHQISELKRYMARGVSVKDAAMTLRLSPVTAQSWLNMDDNAIAETKNALLAGEIGIATARVIAAEKNPEKQREALKSTLASKKPKTAMAARKAVAKASGKADDTGVNGKRMQRRLLDAVVAANHPNATPTTLAWWQGVEDALKAIVGEEIEPRLAAMIAKIEAE